MIVNRSYRNFEKEKENKRKPVVHTCDIRLGREEILFFFFVVFLNLKIYLLAVHSYNICTPKTNIQHHVFIFFYTYILFYSPKINIQHLKHTPSYIQCIYSVHGGGVDLSFLLYQNMISTFINIHCINVDLKPRYWYAKFFDIKFFVQYPLYFLRYNLAHLEEKKKLSFWFTISLIVLSTYFSCPKKKFGI